MRFTATRYGPFCRPPIDDRREAGRMSLPDPVALAIARQIWELAEPAPEEILLCGSRARGENRPNSDVDLMIVMGQGATRQNEGALSQAVLKLEKVFGLRIEPMYPTGGTLRRQLDRGDHIPTCCMKDAVVLLPEGKVSPYIQYAADLRRHRGEPDCPDTRR